MMAYAHPNACLIPTYLYYASGLKLWYMLSFGPLLEHYVLITSFNFPTMAEVNRIKTQLISLEIQLSCLFDIEGQSSLEFEQATKLWLVYNVENYLFYGLTSDILMPAILQVCGHPGHYYLGFTAA